MSKQTRKRTLEIQEIIKLYEEGESTTEIAKRANVSARYIRMLLKDNNIEMRPRGSWKRKYTLNEDYFKKWSNNMAYILGFFVADGNIPSDLQLISIAQKEKYILEDIRKEVGSNHPLYKNEKTGVYTLNLNSKIMKSDLINIHGIKPNKSKNVSFPYVPEQYMSHFIRGYFDGDGYINYSKYTVTFVGGSETFMRSLESVLIGKGFKPQYVYYNNNYRLHIRGRKSIKVFSNWIYTDKELYLKRKYKIFNKEELNVDQLKDSKHDNTAKGIMERKLYFLTILALTESYTYACNCLEIKPATPKRWIKNDNLFQYNFEKIKEEIELK